MSVSTQWANPRLDFTGTITTTGAYLGTAIDATGLLYLEMPVGATSVTFIADIGAPGGTTATYDVAIQCSPDAGTTWYTFWRFAQVTTAGGASKQLITVSTIRGPGEAGATQVIANVGGAQNANITAPRYYRWYATKGGTTAGSVCKFWAVFTAGTITGMGF